MSRKPKKGYFVKGHFVAEGSELDQELKLAMKWGQSTSKTDAKRESEELQQLGDLSCEQIYDHLSQQQPAGPPTSNAGGPPRADHPEAGAGHSSAFEGHPQATGHDYEYESAVGADVACSALDRALILREIAGSLAEINKSAGKTAGRWAEVAQRARTRAVPWERLFAERLGGLIPTDYQTCPFSKRHLWRGVYLPSVARKGVGRILFAIDTSGSMSLPVLGQITDQIDQLRQLQAHQALALVGQCGFQLGQRRAAAGGDDQLAGFIAEDARVGPGVQHLALQRGPPEILAAAPAQAQGAAVRGGRTHGIDQVLALSVHGAGW